MRAVTPSALALTALLAVTALSAVPAAHAQPYGEGGPILGYVTVTSIHNPGSVTGPIRQGRFGLQVRLPGGTWLDCERTCAYTLRTQTLDFWQQFRGGGAK